MWLCWDVRGAQMQEIEVLKTALREQLEKPAERMSTEMDAFKAEVCSLS